MGDQYRKSADNRGSRGAVVRGLFGLETWIDPAADRRLKSIARRAGWLGAIIGAGFIVTMGLSDPSIPTRGVIFLACFFGGLGYLVGHYIIYGD